MGTVGQKRCLATGLLLQYACFSECDPVHSAWDAPGYYTTPKTPSALNGGSIPVKAVPSPVLPPKLLPPPDLSCI